MLGKRLVIDTTARMGVPSRVIIDLLPNGQRQIRTEGVPGAGCYEASAPYEQVTQGTNISDDVTPEYYEPPTSEQQTENE